MSKVFLVLTTIDSPKKGRALADLLLQRRLAACVTLLPAADSHYWWKGKIDRSREQLLIIKSSSEKRDGLLRFLKSRHPYEVPELLALGVPWVDSSYLKWLRNCLQGTNPHAGRG